MTDTTQTPFDIAYSYLGEKEISGHGSNTLITKWLKDAGASTTDLAKGDEALWCGAFVHACCSQAGVDLSLVQGLVPVRARSWLKVGTPVALTNAIPGHDIAVFNRGGPQDPDALGKGHVGFFVAYDNDRVSILGGNQSNSVSIDRYPCQDLFGIRRV